MNEDPYVLGPVWDRFYRRNNQLNWDGKVLWMDGGNDFSSTAVLGTKTNNSLQFRTNNVDRMIITNTGNVGIGTTSPVTKLHIALSLIHI